mgnify:CR=1 FL=1
MKTKPRPFKNQPIIIVPYDPFWPVAFKEEAARIWSVVGDLLTSLEHIGSTSVPGLAAKPVIDMLAGLKSLSDTPALVAGLCPLGYVYEPEREEFIPDRRYFSKMKKGSLGYHLHMVEPSTDFYIRHLAFRDYLRDHPDAAAEYAALKIKLSKQYRSDRDGYTNAKTTFIKDIEKKALQ